MTENLALAYCTDSDLIEEWLVGLRLEIVLDWLRLFDLLVQIVIDIQLQITANIHGFIPALSTQFSIKNLSRQ